MKEQYSIVLAIFLHGLAVTAISMLITVAVFGLFHLGIVGKILSLLYVLGFGYVVKGVLDE